MDHSAKPNQETGQRPSSPLINLFEEKGYKCEEITQDGETIYLMKVDVPQKETSFEPKPKIFVN